MEHVSPTQNKLNSILLTMSTAGPCPNQMLVDIDHLYRQALSEIVEIFDPISVMDNPPSVNRGLKDVGTVLVDDVLDSTGSTDDVGARINDSLLLRNQRSNKRPIYRGFVDDAMHPEVLAKQHHPLDFFFEKTMFDEEVDAFESENRLRYQGLRLGLH